MARSVLRHEAIMFTKYHIIIFLSVILLGASSIYSQDESIILKHADHGESHWRYGKVVTILEGHVEFVSGNMTLKSDRATWHQDEGMVVFEGQVSLVDTAQMLWADRLTYLQEERKALADGQVTVSDTNSHLELTAGHVEYERDQRIARADQQPRLVILHSRRLRTWILWQSIPISSRNTNYLSCLRNWSHASANLQTASAWKGAFRTSNALNEWSSDRRDASG